MEEVMNCRGCRDDLGYFEMKVEDGNMLDW